MNTEQINQIVETIKTLNLNLDSQTASEIVKTIMPYLYLLAAKEIVLTLIGWTAFIITVVVITKAIFKHKQNV